MPLRSFGSVSKGELLKQVFSPVTHFKVAGVDSPLTEKGSHSAALLDGVNDACYIELFTPHCFTVFYSCNVIYIGVANIVSMHCDTEVYWGQPQTSPVIGDLYNVRGGASEEIVQTWTDRLGAMTMGAAAGLGAMQNIGIHLTYRAADAHTATNFYVLGAIVRWV